MVRRGLMYGLAITFLLPQVLQAQEAKPPAMLLRVATVDQLLDQIEYLARLAGKEEEAKQMVGFFKAARGEKGIDGIDTKRPIAVYASAPEGLSIPIYLMVPIADEKTFTEDFLAKRLRIEIKKEGDGIRSFELPGLPVKLYLRFANDYVYLTGLDPSYLAEKKLPSVKSIVAEKNSVMDLSLRLDVIPEQIKKFILGQSEVYLAPEKKKEVPNETKLKRELRIQAIDTVVYALRSFLMETKEIAVKLAIDPKSEELSLEWSLTPVEGTKLAKDLAALKEPKNTFGGLGTKEAVFRSTMFLSLPSSLRKAMNAVIDESIEEAMKMIPEEFAKPARGLFEAMGPTLKGGEWDFGVAVLGPDKEGHLSFLFGNRLYQGNDLEAAFKTFHKALPDALTSFLELDVGTVGKTGIHKLDTTNFINVDVEKILDKKASIWLAIGEDRQLIFLGPDGKEHLKESLEIPARPAKILDLSVSVSRLAPYSNLEKSEAIKAVAQTIFGKDSKSDTVTMTLEGGSSLKWRLQVPGKVVKFIGAMQGVE